MNDMLLSIEVQYEYIAKLNHGQIISSSLEIWSD